MNPFDMMKNLQGLQERMKEVKEKMKTLQVTGSAGGDMVEVDMNGEFAVLDVRIAPEAVDPEDQSMLEDLVLAAVSDAVTKMKEAMQGEMSDAAGGLPLDDINNMLGMS